MYSIYHLCSCLKAICEKSVIKTIGLIMELSGIISTVVQICISIAYLCRNRDERKIILEGNQHNALDSVRITN